MTRASIEATLELWASSLRDVKGRMRPLFTQDRVAASANPFLDGLVGAEQRKTGWMRAEAVGDPGPWRQQAILGRGRWDADALRDIVRDYALETLADPDAVLVLDETGFLKQGKASCGVGRQYTGSAGKITNCNLSAVQFRNRNLIAVIVNALAASGLHPSRLELEITESVLLSNNSQTMEMLRQLTKVGVAISLDDFDAGYSGLGYLRSIQFDKVKIDKSFIREMASRGESLAIIQAAVGLATSLGISTTAEGLETEEQLREVVIEGCIEGQGFFFSKPLPAVRVPEMIERVRQMRRRFEGSEIGVA